MKCVLLQIKLPSMKPNQFQSKKSYWQWKDTERDFCESCCGHTEDFCKKQSSEYLLLNSVNSQVPI